MNGVPTELDWSGYKKDFDGLSAYKTFFGKNNNDVQADFQRDVLSRVSELRFMPDIPFQYYMIGFKEFVLERNFRQFTSADAANSFLELIEDKLVNNPSSIISIMSELVEAIDFIADNQNIYDADEEIYGSFSQKAKRIKELIKS